MMNEHAVRAEKMAQALEGVGNATPASDFVTERVEFTEANEIDRALPTLLSDNAKMTVQAWEEFCDKVDASFSTLGKIKILSSILWFAVVALAVFAAVGPKINRDGNNGTYYGIIIPCIVVLMFLACELEDFLRTKAASKITNICASTANDDRELSLKLVNAKKEEISKWYIEVGLRNVPDVPAFLEEDDDAIPEADAVPLGSQDPSSGGLPPPKKYVKDAYGKMTLNPDYKAWKKSNP